MTGFREAIHLSAREMTMDRFAALAMTGGYGFASLRHIGCEVCVCLSFLKIREVWEDRVPAADHRRKILRLLCEARHMRERLLDALSPKA